VLNQVAAAIKALRPDLPCNIRVLDRQAGGYRLIGRDETVAGRAPVLRFGEGLTHVVAETRRPLLVEDVQADPRTAGREWYAQKGLSIYYGVPIEAGDELLGVLNVSFPAGQAPTADERELIDLFASHAAVAIRNARLFAQSESRRLAAEALLDLSRTMSQALEPGLVARRVSESVRALLGVQSSSLFRLDPESGALVSLNVAGAEDVLGGEIVFPRGMGLVGMAVANRCAVATPDVLADDRVTLPPEWRARVQSIRLRAVLAVPLILGGRALGALTAADQVGRVFDEDSIRLAQAFADQAAVALDNARLFEAAGRERRRLEVLSEVSARVASVHDAGEVLDLIVNEAVRILAADAGGLRLLEGDELVLRARTASAAGLITRASFKVGESLSGLPVATGEATAVADVRDDVRYDPIHRQAARELGFQSFLGVPLRAHGRVLGSLYVYSLGQRRFEPDEISLLSAFADQASLVIDKDRLIQEARTRAARLRTLARLHQLISASLDTDEVLHAITRAGAELMDAPLVAISLVNEVTGILERRAFSDDVLGADHPGARRRLGEGAMGWVAVHRRPLNVPDVLADDRVLAQEWCRRHGFTSALVVPILFQESLLGVLVLFGRAPFAMDAADQDLLESFLAQAALAIHNASVHEELRAAHQNLERSQEQLIHSEKLSALGQLVAGVAHELNNPLSVVLGNAYLAEPKVADPLVQRHLKGIREGAERAAQIVRNLLQFARKLTSSREDIEIDQLVERVLTLVANAGATQNISIVRDLAPGLPSTSGDPGQIQQVLLNLVTNAFQAMEDSGGQVTVRSRSSAGRLRIEVEDTGPGVPAEIRTRIFDPFFTTKPVGTGTGLGLSVAHGIVSAHEGRIWVEEAPGGGARFVIELPVRTAAPTGAEREATPVRRDARILVIDDEEHVARVLGDLLEELGARVEITHSASAARALLAREHFDLITIDVIMPGENGVDLWRQLRAEDPSAAARVIFVTGNIDPSIQASVDSTGRPVLAKPYTFKALRALVASELETRRGAPPPFRRSSLA
jgi:GAF domain-containing protein/ActR/RegA family two-component response regulator